MEKRELSSLIHTALRIQALSQHLVIPAPGYPMPSSRHCGTCIHMHIPQSDTQLKIYCKAVTVIITQKGGASRYDGTNNASTWEARHRKITTYKTIPAHIDLVSKQLGRQHKLNRRPVIGAY